jgi:phage gpG-like protein
MSGAAIAGLEATLERLQSLPGAVQEGLARALARASLDLQADAQGKLSDGVLRSRTGALRDSILATISTSATGVSAEIGSDLPYAAFQEYGFQGIETVSAHLRTIKQAFGRPLRAGSERIAVGAHDRKVAYPAHSFLRAALADRETEIMSGLETAVAEVVTA